jgi:hypothetical protein
MNRQLKQIAQAAARAVRRDRAIAFVELATLFGELPPERSERSEAPERF